MHWSIVAKYAIVWWKEHDCHECDVSLIPIIPRVLPLRIKSCFDFSKTVHV
jgi:hypothetical protein